MVQQVNFYVQDYELVQYGIDNMLLLAMFNLKKKKNINHEHDGIEHDEHNYHGV